MKAFDRSPSCHHPLAIASIASFVTVLTILPAHAATFTGNGTGFTIPDNSPTGASSTIVVTDNFSISDITVTLISLNHNFIGDLIATLTKVDTGTTVSLFNRIGRVGNTGFGDNSNFSGTYRFNDAFAGDIWGVASGGNSTFNVPGGDYYPTAVDSGALIPILPAFTGASSAGTWRLTISDNAASTTGSLGSWTLNLVGASSPTAVPEPGSLLGLFALGLMGAGSALRRK
jgi:subtilisin-like proprotein convertase family protein